MMVGHRSFYVASIVLMAFVGLACSESAGTRNAQTVKAGPLPVFSHADVELLLGRGTLVNKTKRVDAATAERLASYFPGMGKGKKSGISALWLVTVKITFYRADANELIVGSNYVYWAEGKNGDFPVKGDLRSFIESLFESAEVESMKGIGGPG